MTSKAPTRFSSFIAVAAVCLLGLVSWTQRGLFGVEDLVRGTAADIRQELQHVLNAKSDLEVVTRHEDMLKRKGIVLPVRLGDMMYIATGTRLVFPLEDRPSTWLFSWKGGIVGPYLPSQRVELPVGRFIVGIGPGGVRRLDKGLDLAEFHDVVIGLDDKKLAVLNLKSGLALFASAAE